MAGFIVLVILKYCMSHRMLLAKIPDPKSDPLGAELRKAVPVAFAALVAWFVFKLQPHTYYDSNQGALEREIREIQAKRK